MAADRHRHRGESDATSARKKSGTKTTNNNNKQTIHRESDSQKRTRRCNHTIQSRWHSLSSRHRAVLNMKSKLPFVCLLTSHIHPPVPPLLPLCVQSRLPPLPQSLPPLPAFLLLLVCPRWPQRLSPHRHRPHRPQPPSRIPQQLK